MIYDAILEQPYTVESGELEEVYKDLEELHKSNKIMQNDQNKEIWIGSFQTYPYSYDELQKENMENMENIEDTENIKNENIQETNESMEEDIIDIDDLDCIQINI